MNGALRVGYLGYPGFSGPDGNGEAGLARALFASVSNEINGFAAKVTWKHCRWDQLTDSLTIGKLDLIVDPVIPMPSRHQLEIIPYCSVNGFYLVHEKSDKKVKQSIIDIGRAFNRSPHDGVTSLFGLGNEVKLAVGAGFYDDEILDVLEVRHIHFSSKQDPVTSICERAKAGKVVVTDGPFARAAVAYLDSDPEHEGEFKCSEVFRGCPNAIRKLFGFWPAGFAVRKEEEMEGLIAALWEINLPKRFSQDIKGANAGELGVKEITLQEAKMPVLRNFFRRQRVIDDMQLGLISSIEMTQDCLESDLPLALLPAPAIDKRSMYRAIFREDEEGLSSFLHLVDDGRINVARISEGLGVRAATLFITRLISAQLATLQGEILMPTDHALEIAKELAKEIEQ